MTSEDNIRFDSVAAGCNFLVVSRAPCSEKQIDAINKSQNNSHTHEGTSHKTVPARQSHAFIASRLTQLYTVVAKYTRHERWGSEMNNATHSSLDERRLLNCHKGSRPSSFSISLRQFLLLLSVLMPVLLVRLEGTIFDERSLRREHLSLTPRLNGSLNKLLQQHCTVFHISESNGWHQQ